MPMFSSNVLPDVSGRSLGASDKQWDGFFRNVVVSGSLSGSGLATSDVVNPVPDVDSINVQSGLDANSLKLRFQISNPSTGPVQALFKNIALSLGGVVPADSHTTPMRMYGNTGDVDNFLTIYRLGSLSIPVLFVDNLGRLTSYIPGYTTFAYQVARQGEANGIWLVDSNGSVAWGAGGNNAFDTFLTRIAASSLSLNNGSGGWANLSLGQLNSNVAQGTPPFTVVSNTLVTNLNADKLDGADWAAPPAIGNTTPNDGHFASLSATAQFSSTLNDGVTPPLAVASAVPVASLRVKFGSDFTVESSLVNDGSGFKHKRVTTGSVAASGNANVVITWTTPFGSANYTALASVFDSFGGGGTGVGLRISRITQLDATHIAVLVVNDDTSNAHTGTVQAIGIKG